MLKTFLQTEQYLYKLIPTSLKKKYPAELGLLRMLDLLKRLDNPHHQFPSIHIAGTAGKGSTTYLIAKIMQEAGYKVGFHTSPHLQTMRERIIINEQLISRNKFISLINQIDPIIKEMNKKSQYGEPSYFEVLVAATFLYFKQKKVDLAVIEVGMGGQYDGTNVLKSKVAVVTNVGLDHINILGKTKQTILKGKMQIIKTNVPTAITGIKQNYLLKIIKEHCQKKKVPLVIQEINFKAENAIFKENYSQFDYVGKKEKIKNIKINLPGVYQVDNACLAITACLQFVNNNDFKLTKVQIKKALSKTFFPGRMEVISKNPLIILDGAHNEDKMKALVKSIKEIYPQKKFLVIFGVKKDKDSKKMIKTLKTISNQFILTQFGQATDLGFKLNLPVEKLYRQVKKIAPQANISIEKTPSMALKRAQKMVKNSKETILLTGSLYLVGEARDIFKLKPHRRSCLN